MLLCCLRTPLIYNQYFFLADGIFKKCKHYFGIFKKCKHYLFKKCKHYFGKHWHGEPFKLFLIDKNNIDIPMIESALKYIYHSFQLEKCNVFYFCFYISPHFSSTLTDLDIINFLKINEQKLQNSVKNIFSPKKAYITFVPMKKNSINKCDMKYLPIQISHCQKQVGIGQFWGLKY